MHNAKKNKSRVPQSQSFWSGFWGGLSSFELILANEAPQLPKFSFLTTSQKGKNLTASERDSEAIRSDWESVGKSIKSAIGQFEEDYVRQK